MLSPRVHSSRSCTCLKQYCPPRFSLRLLSWLLIALLVVWIPTWQRRRLTRPSPLDQANPLVNKYIELSRGDGGRWFIPSQWIDFDSRFLQPYPDLDRYMDIRNPRTPAEAANMALELCMRQNLYLEHTKIPLIIHQTWKELHTANWTQHVRDGVEAWLSIATGQTYPDLPKMAYVLWDDDAVDALIQLYEDNMWTVFEDLPRPVEKADIFRIAVLRWFGGIYVDVDTDPLQHPFKWVQAQDVTPWADPLVRKNHSMYEPSDASYCPPESAPYRPHLAPDSPADLTTASYAKIMAEYRPTSLAVGAIFGLEADTDAHSDDYWRAGYSYPVQLTNWAVGMAPHHPVSKRFLGEVAEHIRTNMSDIEYVDPLELAGPPSLTKVVKDWVEYESQDTVWESVSGIFDAPGGRGKVIAGDVLVLPITGFSPGRGRMNNMGSQPINHPNARLVHIAQGSWRHAALRVQLGKLCRTLFGRCKDWSKIS